VWRNGVALLGSRETPAALQRLHAAIGAALVECELTPERRPYRPHLTLARRAYGATPAPPLQPLEWHVGSFALVDSERSPARYLVLERYRAVAR
jgi:2'-5' RNA ligase